jgi:2-succinyl-5-enolpyruvyl-6-hydroxy-3-cyclohexene-1-carboxylate synthase
VVDPGFGWNEPTRRAETVIRGDSAATAAGLAERLTPPDPEIWTAQWLRSAGEAAEAIEAELDRLDQPSEPGLQAALGRLYSDGDLVYTASSMPIRDQECFLAPAPARVWFLCNRGANGIDGLVSSGIGAAAATGRPTWIVTGDLGLYHDMNGLAALHAVETPVRIVVPNNSGGAIFEFLPQAELIDRDEFESLFATPVPLSIERIANLYGLAYRRVDDLGGLAGAAREPRAIIEVPVDRSGNVALHRRLAEAGAAALAAARGP